MRKSWTLGVLATVAGALAGGRAAEPAPPADPAATRADEPLAAAFSLERAARALDTAALDWVRTRNCAACHTVFPYLMARPALAAVVPPPADVRQFLEDAVAGRRETAPIPADAVTSAAVGSAAALAFHDAATTGRLHPRTRLALDRMWALQRPDGGWQWPFRDTPPMKSDEHYGVTLAVLGAGVAPDGYARTEAARRGLERARHFLRAHPPASLHQRAMLLWAGRHVDGLLTPAEAASARADLLAAQRPDGGWSMASLVAEPARPGDARAARLRAEPGYGTAFLVIAGRDAAYRTSLASDGYATGFAVYVARQAGVPANDPALRRGIDWLKRHQRASGRWFTPSQAWHTQHRIANAGTAFAVLALHACGEVPGRRE